jgi:hypothetical protein
VWFDPELGELAKHLWPSVHNFVTEYHQKLRQWEFYQLSVIADSYSSAKQVAEKMRSLFNGPVSGINMQYRGQRWVGGSDTSETKHLAVDFRIAETLT